MIKTFNQLEIERNVLNLVRDSTKKTIASIVLTGERLTAFPSKLGKRPLIV